MSKAHEVDPKLRYQFDNPLSLIDENTRRALYRKTIVQGFCYFIGGFVFFTLYIYNTQSSGYRQNGAAIGLGLCYISCYGLYTLLTFKLRAQSKIGGMLVAQHPELTALQKERKQKFAQKLIISPLLFFVTILLALLASVAAFFSVSNT